MQCMHLVQLTRKALVHAWCQDVRTGEDSRVSIENNAGITGALAGLINAPGSHDVCLQSGSGLLGSGDSFCTASSIIVEPRAPIRSLNRLNRHRVSSK